MAVLRFAATFFGALRAAGIYILVKDKSRTRVQKLSELMIAGTNKRKAMAVSIRKVRNLSVASIKGHPITRSGLILMDLPPKSCEILKQCLGHARKHSNDMLKCQY